MESHKMLLWMDDDEVEYQDDLYSENYLEDSVDDDTISGSEYGFMMGYLRTEELEE